MKITEIDFKFTDNLRNEVQIWRRTIPFDAEVLSVTADEGITRIWILSQENLDEKDEGMWIVAVPPDKEILEAPGMLVGVIFHLNKTWHIYTTRIRNLKRRFYVYSLDSAIL